MLSIKALLTITAGFSALLTALVGVQDWLRPVERAQFWNARRLKRQAVEVLDLLDDMNSVRELKLSTVAWTYPNWSISDAHLFGRRGGLHLRMRGAQVHLDVLRIGALLPKRDVWTSPYDRRTILRCYDEAIRVLDENVKDPDRKGRSVVTFRVAGLVVTFFLVVAAALS